VDFRAWTLDLAREQCFDAAQVEALLQRSSRAGYTALGLYVEHRFQYRSAPWARADACLGPDDARRLSIAARAAGVRLIPFLNTLGHMEGFIGSEGGQWLAEGPADGVLSLQMCASRDDCRSFARGLVSDVLGCFDDEWVHLGGDETRQLGQCPECASRAARLGGAGGLYGEYFGDLCRWVLQQGRRPCLWADMLLKHPDALGRIPRETVLFDWQYDRSPAETTRLLRGSGFEVVCCPALHTFDSAWCFLDATLRNVDEHVASARECGARGVCVTTWELTHFTSYESVWPLVFAAGRRLGGADWTTAISAESDVHYARGAEILGREIPACSGFLAPGTWRQLRQQMVMRQNPFRLWRAWRDEACASAGDRVLALCEEARHSAAASGGALLLPIQLHRTAVRWVRCVERAAQEYASRGLAAARAALADGLTELETLRPLLRAVAEGGGSRVDLGRLDRLCDQVRLAGQRLESMTSTGAWRPSFELLVSDGFLPGDQAGWGTRA